jgi:hypothetical protein
VDRQIEADAKSGKLAVLLQEAVEAKKNNQLSSSFALFEG